MARQLTTEYTPDIVSPPGESLADILEERGISQAELAERTGRPFKTINEIIKGKAAITPQTALQLERVLGTPARFWNNREAAYREYLARAEADHDLADHISWLRDLPIRDMIRWGWILRRKTDSEQVAECLAFFGVASVAAWRVVYAEPQATFRRSSAFEFRSGAIAAWLRQGERLAQAIECRPYHRDAFRTTLRAARDLTTTTDPGLFIPRLQALCAGAGVAVVFVPSPPGTGASGATRWLARDKALIQLSLRYRSDDHLWFTYFHEAGHILLHGKRGVYLEADGADGDEEGAANRFAADWLIPPAHARRLPEVEHTTAAVEAFAAQVGVAPGIVVGRMQHDGLVPYRSRLNDLKAKFEWVTDHDETRKA